MIRILLTEGSGIKPGTVHLEAGEAVRVDRATVELALHERSGVRQRLPLARGVRDVRVSPDDRVIPAAEPRVR
jgi:hypothetical protein